MFTLNVLLAERRETQAAPCVECIDNKLNILTGEVAVLSHGSFVFPSFCFVSAGMSFRCPPLERGTKLCTRIVLYTCSLKYKCFCVEASSPNFASKTSSFEQIRRNIYAYGGVSIATGCELEGRGSISGQWQEIFL
jgi:hypothetical protein